MRNFFSWVLGGCFLLLGMALISESFVASISAIIASAVLLPPVRSFVYKKTGQTLSLMMRTVTVIGLLFVIGGLVPPIEEESLEESREKIIASIKTALSENNYHYVIEETDKYLGTGNEEIKELGVQARELLEVAEMQETKSILAELKDIPIKEYAANKSLYQKLVNLNPDNEKYADKLSFYSEKLDPKKTSQEADQDNGIKEQVWVIKGKAAVRSMLKDSDSAEFRNVYFHRAAKGVPVTCGEVNSKNSVGEYSGYQKFVSGGEARLTFLEEEVDDFKRVWKDLCA